LFIAVKPRCLKPNKHQLLKVHFMTLGRSPSIPRVLLETLINQISAKETNNSLSLATYSSPPRLPLDLLIIFISIDILIDDLLSFSHWHQIQDMPWPSSPPYLVYSSSHPAESESELYFRYLPFAWIFGFQYQVLRFLLSISYLVEHCPQLGLSGPSRCHSGLCC
jgi:hypothetical protein